MNTLSRTSCYNLKYKQQQLIPVPLASSYLEFEVLDFLPRRHGSSRVTDKLVYINVTMHPSYEAFG